MTQLYTSIELSRVLTYNIIKVKNFGVTNHGRRVRFNQVDLTIQWITQDPLWKKMQKGKDFIQI